MHLKLVALNGELFGALPALSSEEEERKKKGKGKELNLEERDARERNHSAAVSSPSAAGFDEFWKIYRIRKGKGAALRAWCKHGCARFAPRIIAAAERMQAEDRAWLEGFQPHPATWLNAGGWDDEPVPPVRLKSRAEERSERLRRWVQTGQRDEAPRSEPIDITPEES